MSWISTIEKQVVGTKVPSKAWCPHEVGGHVGVAAVLGLSPQTVGTPGPLLPQMLWLNSVTGRAERENWAGEGMSEGEVSGLFWKVGFFHPVGPREALNFCSVPYLVLTWLSG